MLILERRVRADGGSSGLSFRVGPEATSLSVACRTNGEALAIVVVSDPEGGHVADIALGLSHFPREAYLSEERASLNATRRAPMAGEYSLTVYRFAPGGADVDIRVAVDEPATDLGDDDYQELPWFSADALLLDYERVREPASRYYRGDLHAHTRLSDGDNPVRRAIDIAESRGLDFIAFTEHNRVAAGMLASRALLVPSYELTLPIGHFNIHGLDRPPLNAETLGIVGSATSYEALADSLLDHHGQGCNRSLNHPFLEPWQLRYGGLDLARIDTIELFCDPTYPSSPAANDAAVDFLDAIWESGYRMYGIGGSDSHLAPEERYPGSDLPSIYGDPTTYVYCDGLSIANILRALKRGHAYVCRLATISPSIEADGARALPGDRVPDDRRAIRYTVEIEDCPQGWSARFVADGRVVSEVRLTGPTARVEYEAPADGFSWLRFGLVDAAGHQAAYVNPVYTGSRARASGPALAGKRKGV